MTVSQSEKTDKKSPDTFSEYMPRALGALIVALSVVGVISFLCIFLWSLIDFFIHPNINTPSQLSEKIRISFGVAFFVMAYAGLIAIPCVGLFGLPAILLGWRFQIIRWWTCTVGGSLCVSIPVGLFQWKTHTRGLVTSSANGVQYWINGVPTLAGWDQFLTTLLIVGLLGAVGGLSFWLILQFLSRFNKLKQAD